MGATAVSNLTVTCSSAWSGQTYKFPPFDFAVCTKRTKRNDVPDHVNLLPSCRHGKTTLFQHSCTFAKRQTTGATQNNPKTTQRTLAFSREIGLPESLSNLGQRFEGHDLRCGGIQEPHRHSDNRSETPHAHSFGHERIVGRNLARGWNRRGQRFRRDFAITGLQWHVPVHVQRANPSIHSRRPA